MNTNNYKYLVRLPLTMRDQLAESARYYRRSINSDIVARLQQSFSGLPSAEAQRALAPMLHDDVQRMFHHDLSAEEEQLVLRYRQLSAGKRLALLDLLR
ncbi:MAG: Arc family DNA-binding protein [Pseudomonadales bacterium]